MRPPPPHGAQSAPWGPRRNGATSAERGPHRASCARWGAIPGVFERGATQPAGMHRPSNAARLLPRAAKPPMKLCRFDDGRLGLVEPGQVRDVTAALDVLPAYRYPLPPFDPLIANLDAVIARARTMASHAPAVPLRSLTLLSPVANLGKIACA